MPEGHTTRRTPAPAAPKAGEAGWPKKGWAPVFRHSLQLQIDATLAAPAELRERAFSVLVGRILHGSGKWQADAVMKLYTGASGDEAAKLTELAMRSGIEHYRDVHISAFNADSFAQVCLRVDQLPLLERVLRAGSRLDAAADMPLGRPWINVLSQCRPFEPDGIDDTLDKTPFVDWLENWAFRLPLGDNGLPSASELARARHACELVCEFDAEFRNHHKNGYLFTDTIFAELSMKRTLARAQSANDSAVYPATAPCTRRGAV